MSTITEYRYRIKRYNKILGVYAVSRSDANRYVQSTHPDATFVAIGQPDDDRENGIGATTEAARLAIRAKNEANGRR